MTRIIEIIQKIILNVIVGPRLWRLTLIKRGHDVLWPIPVSSPKRQRLWAALEFRLNKGGYVKRI